MQFKAIVPAASCLAVLISGHAMAGTFEKTATGIVVKPDSGAKEVRLEVMNDNIIHVVKTDQAGKQLTPSLMTVAAPVSGNFAVTAQGKDKVTPKALAGTAKVTDKQMLAWLVANSTMTAYPGAQPPGVAQGFAIIFEVPATAEHSNDLLSVLAAAATHSTTT